MRIWEVLARLRSDHCGTKPSSDHVHAEDLERFALSKVDEDERAEITAHIHGCEDCRGQLEEARWFAFHYNKAIRKQGDLRPEERRKERCVEISEAAKVKVLQPPEATAPPRTRAAQSGQVSGGHRGVEWSGPSKTGFHACLKRTWIRLLSSSRLHALARPISTLQSA
jgi:hypothetical protein